MINNTAEFTRMELASTVIFFCAVIHTFFAGFFKKLSHKYENHKIKSAICHILSEIELIFVIWACLFIIAMIILQGFHNSLNYLTNLRFTEPFFVLTLMMVTGTKPIIHIANSVSENIASILCEKFKLSKGIILYFICLSFIPILGSLISEPAAMTIAALMLNQHFFSKNLSQKFKYATIAVLFVNISVGGALTSFAAPPILMVTNAWNWNTAFVFNMFGIKSIIIVLINTLFLTVVFYKNLSLQYIEHSNIKKEEIIPLHISLIHILLLAGIIIYSHYISALIIILAVFFTLIKINKSFLKPLMIKQSIMVCGFLASLVIMGSYQSWWLKPLLLSMDSLNVFFGAAALTAFTDNAAITYLASLIHGLNADFKYSIVSGAIAGGGLTIIANAPNPIGASILQSNFKSGIIKPLKLLLYALMPTLVCLLVFSF